MLDKKSEAGNLLPQVFQYTDKPVRVIMVENQPWFVAKDVCFVLTIRKVSDAVKKLDDDEKLMPKVSASGQNRSMWCVNESGIYNLIFRSNKPEAKAFRKWVTAEVLPALRQKGSYSIGESEFTANSKRLKQRYVELPEYRPLIEMVDKATIICGSQEQLARRIGTTNSTLSLLHHRPWLVSDENHRAIETGCRNLLSRDGKLDTEALEQLLLVDDREIRISLFKKMQKGGLL